MRTILATGGVGFIGGRFVHLAVAGCYARVVNLGKRIYLWSASIKDGIEQNVA